MSDGAQNRSGTGRDPRTGLFLSGVSGNPGGRPKGLRALIRAKSKDGRGEELVDFLFAVVRGEVKEPVVVRGEVYEIGAGVKDRRGAAEYLIDQMEGKATQPLKVDGEYSTGLEDVPSAELKAAFARAIAEDPELLDLAVAERKAKLALVPPPESEAGK